MKIETRSLEDHQVSLIVTLESTQMVSAKHRAARKISERKSIPGFRPGKAPFDVVLRTIGEGTIVEEAVDILLDEIYPKALEEAKIIPGDPGRLEKIENLETNPVFTFIVPLSPQVDLGDYRSVRVPYDWKEPGEQEVENSLEELRQMYAKTETVNRPIQIGDFVLVDVKGEKGKTGADENPIIDRAGFPVFIRSEGKPDEWPYSGFAAKLIGANVNETISFSHKYPKDHPDDTIKGLTVRFEVGIKMVRGSILPDMNDEFAKSVGPFENFQALRDSVKANLISRSRAEYDDDFFSKVMDAIKTNATIKYSPQAVDHETEHVIEDIKSRLAKQSMDLAAYLKTREIDEDKFISEEARPAAVKRLERSLLLDEIAKAEKIEVSKDQLDNSFQQTVYELSSDENFQKYLKGKSKPPKKLVEALTMESANRAFLQQVLERLKAIATGQFLELHEPILEEKTSPIEPKSRKKSSTKKESSNDQQLDHNN